MASEKTNATPADARTPASRMMPLLIVIVLMGAEGIGVFLLARSVSPDPTQALAERAEGADDGDSDDLAEIELVECRPSNMMAGKLVTFHIRVSALVTSADVERAERLARAKRARLEDGVNTAIRSAEPRHFYEPGLETIKRRLKREFDDIFGDDQLIKKVLIPHLLQSGRGV